MRLEIVVVAALFLSACAEAPRAVSTSPGTSEEQRVRMAYKDVPEDDAARALFFKAAITKAGQRCDEVTRALMGEPGNWTVTCAPGYAYAFQFYYDKGDQYRVSRLR